MEQLESDVVVIGSGLAGLVAALAAHKEGARVLLINKTPVGSGSNTLLSGGGFRGAAKKLSVEQHYAETVESGRGLCVEELVAVLAGESQQKIRELSNYGVRIKELSDYYTCEGRPYVEGTNIIKPLLKVIFSHGIQVRGNLFAWDLLVDEGKVQGLWGFERSTGRPFLISAPAVILATGGAGTVYQRTNNSGNVTGDGYAMAFRGGVSLMDMEFVQFYPLGLVPEKRRWIHPLVAEAGNITNALGENIVEKYHITARPLCIKSRDRLSRAIYTEVSNGLGINGAAKLDVTSVSQWEKIYPQWGESRVKQIRETLDKLYRISIQPLYVLPTCHFFMGGVAADEHGATSLPGLYVAGEVMGGLHGANRLGGNALSECAVFGDRAGTHAARHASSQKMNSAITALADKKHNELLLKLEGCCSGAGSAVSPWELKQFIKKVMWEKVGVIREEKQIKEALNNLGSVFKNYKISTEDLTAKMFTCLEIINMKLVAEMIASSALWRRESRGAHYRLDYPDTDNANWIKNSMLKNREGQITFLK